MHVFKYSTFVLLLEIEPLHSEDWSLWMANCWKC